MLHILWDTRGYFFWLLVVSRLCVVLEWAWPWRKQQKQLRPQLGQDILGLVLNGHYVGIAVASVSVYRGALLGVAILGTLIGHLNHSNLNITWLNKYRKLSKDYEHLPTSSEAMIRISMIT